MKNETAEGLRPLYLQYCEIRRQYPDVLILFKADEGESYVAFGQNAQIIHRELSVKLTGMDNAGDRVPLCRVPKADLDASVTNLIRARFRVAICDPVDYKPERIAREAD